MARKAPEPTARRERRTCPACGMAGYYAAGEASACKHCGAPLDAPGAEPAGPAGPAGPPAPAWEPMAGGMPAPSPVPASARPAEEPALGLAVAALACGLAALATLWVFPVALLLGVAGIALGGVALARHGGDAGVQIMGVIGIVAGSLGLLLALFVMPWMYADSGSSYEYRDDGGSGGGTYEDDGGSGGGGGAGGGSSGGGGGGAGGGGGSGGGGGGGGAPVESVDSPMPAGLLVGASLLGLAAWRRRA